MLERLTNFNICSNKIKGITSSDLKLSLILIFLRKLGKTVAKLKYALYLVCFISSSLKSSKFSLSASALVGSLELNQERKLSVIQGKEDRLHSRQV